MEKLGFNIQSFVINTTVFLAFFVLMHFLVLKKIGGVIAQRKTKMQEADKRAEEARLLLQKAQNNFDNIIAQAKKQAEQIVAQSKSQANDQAKKIIEKAQIDASEIIAKAQGVLAVEKEKMLSDFRSELEKAVKESLTQILADQAEKIDFDAYALKEISVKL